jgi:hypothetical protein
VSFGLSCWRFLSFGLERPIETLIEPTGFASKIIAALNGVDPWEGWRA